MCTARTSDVAVLATIGPDGYPQVTATWFLFDDDGTIKLSLERAREDRTHRLSGRRHDHQSYDHHRFAQPGTGV
jgi:hypothetical protein